MPEGSIEDSKKKDISPLEKQANMAILQALGGLSGALAGWGTAKEHESPLFRAAMFGLGGALLPKAVPELASEVNALLPQLSGISGKVVNTISPYALAALAPLAGAVAVNVAKNTAQGAIRSVFGL